MLWPLYVNDTLVILVDHDLFNIHIFIHYKLTKLTLNYNIICLENVFIMIIKAPDGMCSQVTLRYNTYLVGTFLFFQYQLGSLLCIDNH